MDEIKITMKKYLIFFIIFNFISNSLNAQNLKNDWTKQNLKGKVNKITETSYEIIDSFGIFINSKYRKKTISIFNINGYLIEVDNFEKDLLRVVSKTIYAYNDSGELTERNYYNSNGSLLSKAIFDRKNKMITETILSNSGEVSFITTSNRDNGLIQKQLCFVSGKLAMTDNYQYVFGNNKKVKEMNLIRNKKPLLKVTYKYDQNQRLIEEKNITEYSKRPCITEYKYNNVGYLVERKDCMTKTQIKTFDDLGNQVTSHFFYSKDLTPSLSHEYLYEYFK
jgi:hypothetical protein